MLDSYPRQYLVTALSTPSSGRGPAETITVDGSLDDPAWRVASQAVLIRSQCNPLPLEGVFLSSELLLLLC